MVPLLLAYQVLGERPCELGEAFDAAPEDLRADFAFVEQLLLGAGNAGASVTSRRAHPRRKLLLHHALAALNRIRQPN
jgi:hypothetical protein